MCLYIICIWLLLLFSIFLTPCFLLTCVSLDVTLACLQTNANCLWRKGTRFAFLKARGRSPGLSESLYHMAEECLVPRARTGNGPRLVLRRQHRDVGCCTRCVVALYGFKVHVSKDCLAHSCQACDALCSVCVWAWSPTQHMWLFSWLWQACLLCRMTIFRNHAQNVMDALLMLSN